MSTLLKYTSMLLLLLCSVPLHAADEQRDQVLKTYGYVLWQRINEVRHNPALYLAEHGITRQQAENDLGISDEVLNDGLPPVAWNGELYCAAYDHGDDMLGRLYYSKVSPEGWDPQMRVDGSGYQAVAVGESLGIIAFSNYVEIDQAVEYLLNNMLRDELNATGASEINIFSAEYTEVGISFFAESLELGTELNYVYLAVLDFASPEQDRGFVVAQTAADCTVSLYSFADATLTTLSPLLPGNYQLPLPSHGGIIIARHSDQTLQGWRFVADQSVQDNFFMDLN